MPSELREVTEDLLRNQQQQADMSTRAKTPLEPSPGLPSAHTCGVQELLIYAVREEAEQAMGPGHAPFQVLAGDGLIGIPLLHLTAEGKGKTAQKCGSPAGAPRSPKPLQPPADPSQSGKHCLLLALASSGLGLAETSQGQAWVASELS